MENEKIKENVVIIDGYGFIFRAFFSLKDLKTPDGLPIGAVYGFINMLQKIYASIEIDYIILVFDSGKKSFRNDIYPLYKAQRKEAPADLIPQFALTREAANALNIKYIEVEGFEADDIIASYSRKCSTMGFLATIVTSDKDLMQLAEDGKVRIFDPVKTKFLNEADIIKKFNVKPSQLPDYLAIVGDASDNIPGVAGIGEKGAAELLNTFANLEEIYTNIETIPRARSKELLTKSREEAFLSKRLATLNFEVDVPPISLFKKISFEKPRLFEFLKKYSLNSIIAKLLPNFISDEPQMKLFEHAAEASFVNPESFKEKITIDTQDKLEKIMEGLANQDEIEIDVENNVLTLETSDKIYNIPYIASTSLTSGT